MIDVKKLITGFLILATIAVGSGLALSLIPQQSPSTGANGNTPTGQITINAGSGVNPAAPAHAFVDTGSLQGNAAEILAETETTSTAALVNDPNNFTNIFANSIVDGLAAANPGGFSMNQSGTLNMASPDVQALKQEIASNPAISSFTLPNWDLEAQSQLMKIAPSTSTDAASQYSNGLTNIFNQYFVANNLQGMVSNTNTDSSELPYIDTQTQNALQAVLALRAPSQFSALQQDLVRVMVYQKNFIHLAETANSDPVKTSFIFEGERAKYNSAVADMQQELQKASSLGLSLNNGRKDSVPFIAEILGVQPAHAQWITFNPTQYALTLLEWVNNTLLQILKNALINTIQNHVFNKIMGGSAPLFVKDFGAQLVNSYEGTALNVLNSNIAAAPPSQAPLLNELLATNYTSPQSLGNIANQLVSPDGNLENFMTGNSPFSMNDYLAIFGQGGNVWSNAMSIQQAAINAGDQALQTNKTQNTAQQGWLAMKTWCDDGSDPNYGYHTTFGGQNVPNGGKCSDGSDPVILNPGQSTGQSQASGLQSGTQLITSATDITGIAIAITQSLLSQYLK